MVKPEVAAEKVVPEVEPQQSPSEENAGVGKSVFLEKVQDIPMVHAAKELGTAAYKQVKQMNPLTNYTLNTAESTVLYFALAAKPFLDKIQPQAKIVDDLACLGLEVVEAKAPFIRKTPEQLVEDARNLVTLTVQTSYQKVDDVKNLGTGALSSVKSYGLQKANDALSGTERLVDQYLPPPFGEGSPKEGSDQTITARATQLTARVGQRVYGHGIKQFVQMQKLSQESITRLAYTVELMQHIKENYSGKTVQECVDDAKLKANWIWEELKKEPAEASDADKSLEQRMLSLARRITSSLVHTYSAVPVAAIPQACLDGVRSAGNYAAELFTQFDQAINAGEVASSILQRIRGTISALEGTVEVMLSNVQPSQEIEMEEIKPKQSSSDQSTPQE